MRNNNQTNKPVANATILVFSMGGIKKQKKEVAMNREKIWREFAALPPEAQQLVADFIAFLRTRYKQARSNKKVKPAGNLTDEAFIGIWRDRADMEDSR